MKDVVLKNVTKAFDRGAVAVNDLSLTVEESTLFTLLGPSGCGKTTTLRMIAGLTYPTHGHIEIGGRNVTAVPPHKRGVGMVFQNYALFPHLTVYENVAFGLRARRVKKAQVAERVNKALSLVKLEGLGNRKPSQLSGGQQQRVALARALAIEPHVLLLDEPLSNLDAKLRETMRTDLRKLQLELGITAIYVTHDQVEAMVMSDGIAILNQGVCQQIGSPRDIYFRPANRFVANFIGQANLIPARVLSSGPEPKARISPEVVFDVGVTGELCPGQDVVLCFHPESVMVGPKEGFSGGNLFSGKVIMAHFTGATTVYELDLAGHTVRAAFPSREGTSCAQKGDQVAFYIPPEAIVLLPREEKGRPPRGEEDGGS